MKASFTFSKAEIAAFADYHESVESLISVLSGTQINLSMVDKLRLLCNLEVTKATKWYSYTISSIGVTITIELPEDLTVEILEVYKDAICGITPSVVGFISAIKTIVAVSNEKLLKIVEKHQLIEGE